MYLLLPLITWGGTRVEEQDPGEGQPRSPSHLPRGLWEEAPELIPWQGRNWGLGHRSLQHFLGVPPHCPCREAALWDVESGDCPRSA